MKTLASIHVLFLGGLLCANGKMGLWNPYLVTADELMGHLLSLGVSL